MDRRFKSRWTIVFAFLALGAGVLLYVLTEFKLFLLIGFFSFAYLFVKR